MVNRNPPPARVVPLPAVFQKKAGLERLATGFSNASGLTASDAGVLFFSDAANGKIYRWDAAARHCRSCLVGVVEMLSRPLRDLGHS